MKKQKKSYTNNKGITLIALVISIIVMLILAGVSISAIVGEDGILSKAKEASTKQRIAAELENLNMELASLNIDTITTDGVLTIQDIAEHLYNSKVVDEVIKTSSGNIAAAVDVATKDMYFFGKKSENTYKIVRGKDNMLSAELANMSDGGSITGGTSLITEESFNSGGSGTDKGKFTITDDAEVVFMDSISGNLSIQVKSGVHAVVGIYADMTLTNENIPRSAIDIESGGTLDLYIGDGVTVTVNSGFGKEGTNGDVLGATGGEGGYAGIHVPSTENGIATLKIHGNGVLKSYGGDAGNGGISIKANIGGGGGGGAGAGIGGNGGTGGDGNSTVITNGTSPYTNSGKDAIISGENCGIIYIYDEIKVYAFGGAGGHGGYSTLKAGAGGSGGGGGYPAAGIGGGGAGGGGGDHASGAGGYSGGGGDYSREYGINGKASTPGIGPSDLAVLNGYQTSGGSGYYEMFIESRFPRPYFNQGGMWNGLASDTNTSAFFRDHSGSGGEAGSGGTIYYSNIDNIYAYNGNMITEDNFDYTSTVYEYNIDGTQSNKVASVISKNSEEKIIPAIIFAQNGIIRSTYRTNQHMSSEEAEKYNTIFINDENKWNGSTRVVKITEQVNTDVTGYGQGIGSGAGNLEKSNGSLTLITE